MAKGSSGSDSKGSSSSGSSKGGSSSSSSGSKSGSSSPSSSSSSRNSGGGISSGSGFGGFSGGGEGGPGRSSGSSVVSKSSSSSSGPSSSSPAGGSRAASGGGSTSTSSSSSSRSASSSTSSGRSTTSGTIGNGLASGLGGSGLADKGGRVTGGFDSGRFGDTPAAEKGGRVTGAQTGGKTAAASPDPGRFGGGGASVGRQSSSGGAFANGGVNSDRSGATAKSTSTATSTSTARVGNGLAVGLSAPSKSAREAETRSMGALAASRTPPAGTARRAEDASMAALAETRQPIGSPNYGRGLAQAARAAEDQSMAELNRPSSPNYGAGFGAKAREAEDMSVARHGAWQGALDTIKSVESKRHGYDAVSYASSYGKPSRPDLQTMSIRDVMDWQETLDKSAGKDYRADRTYAGAYQMGKATLGEAAARTGISLDTKFSKATQDYLAQDLVDNRARQATRNGELAPEGLAHSLSKEWAGLPTANGRSYYDGRAGNKAGIAYSESLAAAKGLTDTGAVGPGTARGSRVTAPAQERVAEAPRNVPAPTARPNTLTEGLPTSPVTADISRAAAKQGVDPQQVANYAAAYGLTPEKAAFAIRPVESLPGYRDPYAGAAPARTANIPTPTPRAPAAERFAERYLGAPSVPTPTSRPGVPTPTSRPDQAPVRSTVDKVVAGAIDIGAGLLPVVGPAAAIYGVAAPMLGLPSIGEVALNMRDGSQFDLTAALRTQGGNTGGEGGERLEGAVSSQPRQAATASAAPAPVAAQSFEEKYLAFSDPTPRPTPGEKWGGSGANAVPYRL